MEEFWICYVEGTDGGRHCKYWDLGEAQNEAEKLAIATGRSVYLLRCIGKCVRDQPPIKWEVPR